ncbi:hypothetical protein ACA910_016850 [Epithemia clementina (nom. ined.)]
MKRAEARGETYVYTECSASIESKSNNGGTNEEKEKCEDVLDRKILDNQVSPTHEEKLAAAETLHRELERVQSDASLKSKDRRSAKRKAEAIAAEASGSSVDELLRWYSQHQKQQQEEQLGNKESPSKITKSRTIQKRNPYIVFVGQLSYDTTKDELFRHFQKELGRDHEVTQETLSIRLLTDKKSKKSRGVAFVEVSDPELLYACLKLHHTFLQGRRINVERSAGGKTGSEARKSKIQKLRSDQTDHFNTVIDAVIKEFYENGSIQKGELDDGVVALCKRHSASVVQAALELYVEKHGCDMDNPSAYFTFLLCKLAEEGVFEKQSNDEKHIEHSSRDQSGRPPKKAKTKPVF